MDNVLGDFLNLCSLVSKSDKDHNYIPEEPENDDFCAEEEV